MALAPLRAPALARQTAGGEPFRRRRRSRAAARLVKTVSGRKSRPNIALYRHEYPPGRACSGCDCLPRQRGRGRSALQGVLALRGTLSQQLSAHLERAGHRSQRTATLSRAAREAPAVNVVGPRAASSTIAAAALQPGIGAKGRLWAGRGWRLAVAFSVPMCPNPTATRDCRLLVADQCSVPAMWVVARQNPARLKLVTAGVYDDDSNFTR